MELVIRRATFKYILMSALQAHKGDPTNLLGRTRTAKKTEKFGGETYKKRAG
jgi:hypothetical protein